MDIIISVLLILLLNTILGCLAVYIERGRVTLYDLIVSIIAGSFIFIFVMSDNMIDRIENRTNNITLFEKRNK